MITEHSFLTQYRHRTYNYTVLFFIFFPFLFPSSYLTNLHPHNRRPHHHALHPHNRHHPTSPLSSVQISASTAATSSPPLPAVLLFRSFFHSRSDLRSLSATESLTTTTVNIVRETRLRDDEGERQTRVDGGEERQ